jgi:hypothetical protein
VKTGVRAQAPVHKRLCGNLLFFLNTATKNFGSHEIFLDLCSQAFVPLARHSLYFITTNTPMEKLLELYAIAHPDSVASFLEDFPHLEPILTDAHEHLMKHFGMSVEALELSFEADEEADEEYLFVLVRSSLEPREALKIMDKFDDDWWLDVEEDQIVIALDVDEDELELN